MFKHALLESVKAGIAEAFIERRVGSGGFVSQRAQRLAGGGVRYFLARLPSGA